MKGQDAGIHTFPVLLQAAVGAWILLLGSNSPAQQVFPAPALSPGPNVNISRAAGNQAGVTIAVNRADDRNLFAAANRDSGLVGLFVAVSRNGGTTWTPRIIADGSDALPVAGGSPRCAFDDFGNLFVVFVDQNVGRVHVLLSSDGGDSFELIGSFGTGSVNRPAITTGPNTVWVVFKDFDAGGIAAAGANVTRRGNVEAFGPVQVAPGSSLGDFSDIAVGPQGQVLIAYQDDVVEEGPATIFVHLDPDGLGPLGFEEAVTAMTTNVGGTDFIPAQSFRAISASVGLAYDRTDGAYDGRAYLVYTDETTNGNHDTNIKLSFSEDDGRTWSSAIRLNDDTGTNSQFLPRIAVDQNTGRVAACWYDCRNDQGDRGAGDTNGIANDEAQIFGTVSLDGGLSISANALIGAGSSNAEPSTSIFDFGDNLGLDFFHDQLYPAWADNSASLSDNPDRPEFDIATAVVTFSPLLSIDPTTFPSGQVVEGQIFLEAAAPPDGSVVLLSSAPASLATIPNQVEVSFKRFSKAFKISTTLVDAPASVDVVATFPSGKTRRVTLNLEVRDVRSVEGGGGCFIATAAYGTPLQHEIQSLSKFRDDALAPSSVGTSFIATYYANSPVPAHYLSNSPCLKSVTRNWVSKVSLMLKESSEPQAGIQRP